MGRACIASPASRFVGNGLSIVLSVVNRAALCGPEAFSWWKDWRGDDVAIIASGPSAGSAPIHLLQDRVRAIAVNESWHLARWADVLYACDGTWWRRNKGVPDFAGLRVTYDKSAARDFKGLERIDIGRKQDEILFDVPGVVGDAGNSGFQALNLAVQFGARRILLIGFDMNLRAGLHWHGPHPQGLNNPRETFMARWIKAYERAAKQLEHLGVAVVNASATSDLRCFPVATIEETLIAWNSGLQKAI